MSGPSFDVRGFLHEPANTASVATTAKSGRPALATMWFLLDEGRLWFNSPAPQGQPAPFLIAAREEREVAVLVATFDPPADVRQFRAVGPARIEKRDLAKVRRIYERYIPDWTDTWEAHAASPNHQLWSMVPRSGMAVAFPGLDNSPAYRWTDSAHLFW